MTTRLARLLGATLLLLAIVQPISQARVELVTIPQRENVRIYLGTPPSALIQEERAIPLEQGRNKVTFSWQKANVDGGSLELVPLTDPDKVTVMGIGFPPGSSNSVVWEVDSAEDAEVRFRVTYALNGLRWAPEYTAITDAEEKSLIFTASAVISNRSGEKFRDARVQLGVGEPMQRSFDLDESVKARYLGLPELKVKKTYTFEPGSYNNNVGQHFVITNDADSGLGQEPLYGGKVRMFKRDAQGELAFIGEDIIPFTPLNEEAELYLGNARDIKVERKQLRSDQVNIRRDTSDNIQVYDLDEEFQFKIENHKDEPVQLKLIDHISGYWEMQENSQAYEKTDATTIEFAVDLAPQQEKTVTYRVKRLNLQAQSR
ncbi:MAG: DUF4139 domain-containing protein [Armatimonadota bacterium]